jgi:hypothetical protein
MRPLRVEGRLRRQRLLRQRPDRSIRRSHLAQCRPCAQNVAQPFFRLTANELRLPDPDRDLAVAFGIGTLSRSSEQHL